MKRSRILNYPLATMLALLLVGCGAESSPAVDDGILASGFIEGRSYTTSTSLGGRIATVLVEVGETVMEGQLMLNLDVTQLEHLHNQAQAGVDAAEANLQALKGRPSKEDLDIAELAIVTAEAEREAAQATLELLKATYDPFDPPDEELHLAESMVEIADASVDLARARLKQLEAGSLEGELDMAASAIEEAKANLHLVELQINGLSVNSPVQGVVGQVLVKPGEMTGPGMALVQIRDLQHLTLTLYIPTTQVAMIDYGDEVDVTVDAYPEEVFQGYVTRIADQAQFTPSNVQTQEERVKLVFAVEVLLDDPSGRLKPGMPADAHIAP